MTSGIDLKNFSSSTLPKIFTENNQIECTKEASASSHEQCFVSISLSHIDSIKLFLIVVLKDLLIHEVKGYDYTYLIYVYYNDAATVSDSSFIFNLYVFLQNVV